MVHFASVLRSSRPYCLPSGAAAVYQWLLHGPTGYSSWNVINFQSPINSGSPNQHSIVTRLAWHSWKLFCLLFLLGKGAPLPFFPCYNPSPAISLSEVSFFPATQSWGDIPFRLHSVLGGCSDGGGMGECDHLCLELAALTTPFASNGAPLF